MLPLSDVRSKIFPIWVAIFIAINVVVFIFELMSPNPDAFITKYGLVPSAVNFLKPGTLLPFITSQFVHGGFLHIISNMWFLWIFGDNVEEKLGFYFFPVFYLIAGVLGNFVQYILASSANIPMIGASGAIAGVLGAYYALFPNYKVKTLLFVFIFVTIIELPATYILFYWFIIQLFSGAVSVSTLSANIGGVAYFAHIGGFTLGWVLGKLIQLKKLPPKGGSFLEKPT